MSFSSLTRKSLQSYRKPQKSTLSLEEKKKKLSVESIYSPRYWSKGEEILSRELPLRKKKV